MPLDCVAGLWDVATTTAALPATLVDGVFATARTCLTAQSPAGTKAQCEAELAQLAQQIASKEAELEGVNRQLAAAASQQQQLAAELAAKQRRLTALYEKQGRSAQVGPGAGAGPVVLAVPLPL